MTKMHHCGTCGCCGGYIPCGVGHKRTWRGDGSCPGHVNLGGKMDGTCGALQDVEVMPLDEYGSGTCNND